MEKISIRYGAKLQGRCYMRILNLTIQNLYSFDESQRISFEDTNLAAIVGANGAGKTNLLSMIEMLKKYFLNIEKKRKIATSFDQSDSISQIAIEFEINEVHYSYELQMLCNENRFISEKLYKQNELILDSKLNSDIGSFTDAELERLKTYDLENIGVYGLISSKEVIIEDEQILLEVNQVTQFFQSIVLSYDRRFDESKVLHEDEKVKQKVIEFLNRVGIEIEDIIIKKVKARNLPNNTAHEDPTITALLKALNDAMKISITDDSDVYETLGYRRSGLKNIIHPSQESWGTRTLIKLMTRVYYSENSILIIDEIEKSLHENLLMEVIKEIKSHTTQVLFTSHLIETLTVLDKKELYSVYKEKSKTKVINVGQIKEIRTDRHSLKNQYRAGKIPGYPKFEDIH